MVQRWRTIVKKYQEQLLNDNVDITDVAKSKSIRYIGLQLFADETYVKELQLALNKLIPKSILDKMYIQDAKSIHLTLQASFVDNNLDATINTDILISHINSFFRVFKSLSGNFLFPIVGKSGIVQIFEDVDRISTIRREVSDLWIKSKFKPVLLEEYIDFPYSFVGRFTSKLNQEEIDYLLRLPEVKIPIVFKTSKLCISDKFISPETEQDLNVYQFL